MFREICLTLFLAVSCYEQSGQPVLPVLIVENPSTSQPDFSASRLAQGLQPSTYTLRGTVVNSVTGEPIRNALVQGYFEVQRSVLTGPDGTFQFEGVPATETGNLTVHKPGYFSPQDIRIYSSANSFSQTTRSVPVSPDQSPVILKLIPEGIIYGRITGAGGELIEALPVHILFDAVENGRRVRQEVAVVNTDEDGEFRRAELAEGRYFVFAGPSEAGSFPGRLARQGVQGYPVLFYAGAADVASATPIEITPGKRVEINLTLSLERFYRVSGIASGYPSTEGIYVQFLNPAGQPIGGMVDFDPRSGTFQMQPLPSGLYTITAQAQDIKNQRTFFASRSLNLRSDLSDVHLTLLPGATIRVNARVEITRNDPSIQQPQGFSQFFSGRRLVRVPFSEVPATVTLTANGTAFSQAQYSSQLVGDAENHSLALADVPPGDYAAEISTNGSYYVQSARSGSTDLLREDLTVAPGGSTQPIEIVLRDDFATLDGKISGNAQADSAVVILIPENAPRHPQQVVVNSPDSRFSLSQLAPGPYKVLAVDRLEGFEYSNPEVLRKYLSRARDIDLRPSQTASLDLELVRLGGE